MKTMSWRDHHPGRTIALIVLAIADGATAMSDLTMIRALRPLFGPVPSIPTLWRTLSRTTPEQRAGLITADRQGRIHADTLMGARSRIVIDIDSTIVTTRSDKEQAAGTWKKSFGFHPIVAVDVDRRDVLSVMVRAGNAGSNTTSDHITILDAAINALPARDQAGHHGNTDSDSDSVRVAVTELVARTDAAGQTHGFVAECAARNIRYSVGAAVTETVRTAIEQSEHHDWMAAHPDPKHNKGRYAPDDDPPQVADLTAYVNLDAWPPGARLIVKAETPHIGAQLSLFDTVEGKRHTAIITDLAGDPATIEHHHRNRGGAEAVIRDLKATGFATWPSDSIETNTTWVTCAQLAFNLMSRAQQLTLPKRFRRATPKTIRHRFLHVAACITPTGRTLHYDHTWPWTPTLEQATNQPLTVTNQAA